MIKYCLIFLFFLVGLAPAQEANAWGKWGHVTLCEMTYRYLTDDARAELNRLIKEHPAQEKLQANSQSQRLTSYNYACLYADKNEFGKRVESSRHYLNLERSISEVNSSKCPNDGDCILKGIEEEFTVLKDDSKSDVDRADAAVMLGHWVGDLHQPLHVSFKDDLGGNEVSKKKRGKCSGDNLHAVWDTCILVQGLFKTRLADYFTRDEGKKRSSQIYRYVDDIENRYTVEQLTGYAKDWLDTEAKDWANESFQITLMPEVKYCILDSGKCVYEPNRHERPYLGMRKPPRSASTQEKREYREKRYAHNKKVVIDQAYITKFSPIVEQRLLQASVRLSDMLNTALDPNYNGMPDID